MQRPTQREVQKSKARKMKARGHRVRVCAEVKVGYDIDRGRSKGRRARKAWRSHHATLGFDEPPTPLAIQSWW